MQSEWKETYHASEKWWRYTTWPCNDVTRMKAVRDVRTVCGAGLKHMNVSGRERSRGGGAIDMKPEGGDDCGRIMRLAVSAGQERERMEYVG